MRIAILGRNKIGFIEGTCKKKDYGTNSTDLWDRCNAIILSWIINCVSSNLLSGILYSSNACAVWKDLKERFDKVNGSRILQLHRAIATTNQGTSLIVTYFSKLRELWAEFDCLAPTPGCDCPKSSEYEVFLRRQKLLQFLMGLTKTYEQAREQIMMMDPLPIVNKAYSMLMERECQRSMSNAIVHGDNAEITTQLTDDIGATNHMASNLDIVENKLEVAGIHIKKVHLPNGEVSDVTNMGSCNVANAGRIDNDLCSRKVKVIGKERRGLYLLQQTITRNNKGILKAYDDCKRKIDNCNVSPLARHCRLPFSTSSNRVEDVFHLLHIDVWGPYVVQTFDGNKPFLTIFDDHSRMTWRICVYTPQQNEIAETKHRHVLEIARAMRDVIFKDPLFHFKYKKQEKPYLFVDMEFAEHDTTTNSPTDILLNSLNIEEQGVLDDITRTIDEEEEQASDEVQNHNEVQIHDEDGTRKSTRDKRVLVWMTDYVTATALDQLPKPYSICNYVFYDGLKPTYQSYLGAFSVVVEPKTFYKASKDKRWIESMKAEIQALKDNKAWELVALPAGKTPIGCRWVYKVKYKANGDIERFKAHLVAKGYSQKEDVYNAFLQEDLYDKVYMNLPEGFASQGENEGKKLTTAELDEITRSGSDEPLEDKRLYQRLIGKLLYLTLTRLDIVFVVQTLSQFMQNPKKSHREAAIRVVQYVKREPGLGIMMSSNKKNTLTALCDADWASCPNSRKFVT
ncbi:uncharacterized protein LOC142178297 [Nicotiana tabacum]|uniref:Uncharacterized protein LOC142178297 n=1 Tax=Nicotiana tabacum TaxID=4097 RepID=A0AC58U2X9_TOBAC